MLTEREREVGEWVGEGKTDKEIAVILFVEPCTIRKILESGCRRLGMEGVNRTRYAVLIKTIINEN